MDIGSILGLIIGFGGVLGGFMLEGGEPAALVHEISAPIIVFGGTFGAVLLSTPLSIIKNVPKALIGIFVVKKFDEIAIIHKLTELANKARKDGLLSLEAESQVTENELLKKGLGLIADGIEADVLREVLVREFELRENLHEQHAKVFEEAGGFCPTMGVCGTVMGMIMVLSKLGEGDMGELGSSIATAFLAAMFGVGFANLVFIPAAGRIKKNAEKEAFYNSLIIEGLLSINAGENPRIMAEKLNLSLLEKMAGRKPSAVAAGGQAGMGE
ncbi:MAG: MotA/TolQ/ExbB proton channel family protein [Oscillospiraceae bacterium]|nr:MotA/TolQ/ExbB proton channel family protein [Oscillospiraceae bacterium]